MTIKIKAYQKYGSKTKELVDEFQFCCWKALKKWLDGFGSLHECQSCKKLNENVGNKPSQNNTKEKK